MKKLDIIKSYYEPNINKNLPDHQVLGWESKQAHNMRFEVLADNVDIEGKSILDVGCGLGNLYGFLKNKGYTFRYVGVDILEAMVERARCKFKDVDFRCLDIFKGNALEGETFDIVYASGIFNLNMGNNIPFLKQALQKFYELSSEFIAFNLLHTDSNDKEDTYFYFHPDQVAEIISTTLPENIQVKIIENYLNNDFTVIIKKNDRK